MTAGILDGKATAATIKTELKQRVGRLRDVGVIPGLATVLVGDDPASQNYVRMKHRDCEQVGIASIRVELPADATAVQLEETIAALNADPACTGYIVQLPLPGHLDENRALGLIDPDKDADGLHPINLGRLVLNEPAPLPCTPRGIVELVRRHGIEWRRTSSTMPRGVQGRGAGSFSTSRPRLIGCRPSASLSGSISPSARFSSRCPGRGSCTMYPVQAGSAFSAATASSS